MVEFQVGSREENVEKILEEAEAPVQIKIDMTTLEALFAKANGGIARMLATANITEVTDIASREKAIEMATQARALYNLIEKKRKKIKQPYLEFGQTLDAMVKPLKDRLTEVQGILSPRIKAHMDEEARIAAEAEKSAEKPRLRKRESAKRLRPPYLSRRHPRKKSLQSVPLWPKMWYSLSTLQMREAPKQKKSGNTS